MFWALSMEPMKKYTQTVSDSFHVSQAAIDINSVREEANPTQVVANIEGVKYILATLSKNAKIYQVPLDLNFQKGDVVELQVLGPARVHLSGYYIMEDDEDDLAQRLMAGSDDEVDTDEEVDDDTTALENSISDDSAITSGKKRKKLATAAGKQKKSKLDDSNDDDDEDDDENGDDFEGSTMLDMKLADDSSDDDDDDEDDDDEDDDDDDDDDDEVEEEEAEEEEEEQPKVVPAKNGKNASMNGTGTPANKNKLNASKNETPKTPKEVKKLKQDKTPKQDGLTPKQEKKTPKAATPAKKVLEGGVIAEDLKIGEGPLAKAGKMATVYYAGRLKSNNKQFDANNSGPGFKFRVGRGEVIQGWDVGVAGMRVGGKRRLTIPGGYAYGAKGSPPVIPPNATLVFDVELRNLS